jgi:hypothetical protein
MRFSCLVVALALLATFASDSWGQSNQPSRGNEAPRAEQATKTDQRGTPNQPLSVNIVPTAEQKTDAEKKDNDAAIKAADDKKLVEYTGYQVLIGIVTFFIFVLQLAAFSLQARYMRRTVTEMRKTTHTTIRSTRAAIKAATATVAAERARFFIVIDKTNLAAMTKTAIDMSASSEQPIPFPVEIKFFFKNYGKTPGIIKAFSVGTMTGIDPVDPPITVCAVHIGIIKLLQFRRHVIAITGTMWLDLLKFAYGKQLTFTIDVGFSFSRLTDHNFFEFFG